MGEGVAQECDRVTNEKLHVPGRFRNSVTIVLQMAVIVVCDFIAGSCGLYAIFQNRLLFSLNVAFTILILEWDFIFRLIEKPVVSNGSKIDLFLKVFR